MPGRPLSILDESTNTASFGFKMRQARMRRLHEVFPDFEAMRIVDLGGDTRYWAPMTIRPAHVTIVSIDEHGIRSPEPWMEAVLGDACDLSQFDGQSYDLVFSNSVIEHVGGIRRQQDFANVVRALAPRRWIQTPYRYFPLDPHVKFPFFQSYPLALRAQIVKRWPLSHLKRLEEERTPVAYALEQDLLSMTEMRFLFPESEILRERLVGFTKSLIAVSRD